MDNRFKVIFSGITGSQLYGTATPKSDTDVRGVFIPTEEFYLGFMEKVEQVESHVPDETFWEITKFFKLSLDANPNIIELLFIPDKFIQYKTTEWDAIIANRNLFLSTKARHTFTGYAASQMKDIGKSTEELYNEHRIRGIRKLKRLYSINLIDVEWIKNNFSSNIASEVLNNGM